MATKAKQTTYSGERDIFSVNKSIKLEGKRCPCASSLVVCDACNRGVSVFGCLRLSSRVPRSFARISRMGKDVYRPPSLQGALVVRVGAAMLYLLPQPFACRPLDKREPTYIQTSPIILEAYEMTLTDVSALTRAMGWFQGHLP